MLISFLKKFGHISQVSKEVQGLSTHIKKFKKELKHSGIATDRLYEKTKHKSFTQNPGKDQPLLGSLDNQKPSKSIKDYANPPTSAEITAMRKKAKKTKPNTNNSKPKP
ncbi:MAG: hypothetical protein ABI045_04090 [Flavobacteriales bacterium]